MRDLVNPSTGSNPAPSATVESLTGSQNLPRLSTIEMRDLVSPINGSCGPTSTPPATNAFSQNHPVAPASDMRDLVTAIVNPINGSSSRTPHVRTFFRQNLQTIRIREFRNPINGTFGHTVPAMNNFNIAPVNYQTSSEQKVITTQDISVNFSKLWGYFLNLPSSLIVLKIEIGQNITITDFPETINFFLPRMRGLNKLIFSLKNSAWIDNVNLALEGFEKCKSLKEVFFDGISSCPAAREYHTLMEELRAKKSLDFEFKYVTICDGFQISYGK